MHWLLAQTVDPSTGLGGWTSFGIVGVILSWLLMKHLPDLQKAADAKDKTIKDWIDQKDKQLADKDKSLAEKDKMLQDLLDAKWKLIDSMGVNYRASLKEVTDHCAKEMVVMTGSLKEELHEFTLALTDLSEHVREALRKP